MVAAIQDRPVGSIVEQKLIHPLALARRQRGISQRRLAQLTGYSVNFIGLIERYRRRPSARTRRAFCYVVGLPEAVLFPESQVPAIAQKLPFENYLP